MEKNTFERARVWVFLAVAFGWSWSIALILWLKGGLTAFPPLLPGLPGYLIPLVVYMFGPAIGHIAARLITREGWSEMGLRPQFKRGWKFGLLAWLVTPLLLLMGTAVFYLIFPQYFDPQMGLLNELMVSQGTSLSEVGLPLGVLVALMVVQAALLSPVLNTIPILGEEFGWRAYLQPKLMPLGPRRALLITNVIWGLWHAPAIAMGYNYGTYTMDYFGAPWSGIVVMTVMSVAIGVFFGWVSWRAGTVWPAVIGHGSLNGLAAISVYFSQGAPPLLLGPTAVGLLGGVGFILAALIIWFVPGLMIENAAGE